jgi:cbb3-type cytochrome oxidase maturation protein
MNVLYLLVPAAILLAGVGVWAFTWAVRSGQFDDTTTPAIRALIDDSEAPSSETPPRP